MYGLRLADGWLNAQKRFHFRTLRTGEGTSETGAFQRCRRGSKAERIRDVLVFSDRQRKCAVENIARAKRVNRVHRKSRRLLELLALVEPDGAARSARAGQKRRRQLCHSLKRSSVVRNPRSGLQRLAGE